MGVVPMCTYQTERLFNTTRIPGKERGGQREGSLGGGGGAGRHGLPVHCAIWAAGLELAPHLSSLCHASPTRDEETVLVPGEVTHLMGPIREKGLLQMSHLLGAVAHVPFLPAGLVRLWTFPEKLEKC